MTNDNEKLIKLSKKLQEISQEYLLLSRVNLSFEELNQFNEYVHELAILISQDLEIISSR